MCASLTNSQITWHKSTQNPVISSWWGGGTYALTPAVLYDTTENLYRMWFTGTQAGWAVFHAVSGNGVDWYLTTSNPVLWGGGSSYEAAGVSHAGIVKAANQFMLYYTAIDFGDVGRICLATSSDGINWTKYPANPIIYPVSGTWESEKVGFPQVYFDGSSFFMLYFGYNGTYWETGLATSPDGTNWTRHATNPVLRRGPVGSWDSHDAMVNALVVHDSTFYLFYDGTHPNTTSVGFATSTDAVNWIKYPGNPVFSAGPSGSWDQLVTRGSMILRNNQLQYWYSGYGGSWQIGYATSPFTPLNAGDRPGEVPTDYLLEQSYPNPFNPEALIKYGVPRATHVTIKIFDELGREITTLVDEYKAPGNYSVSWKGKNAASGVYWYRMSAGSFSATKKMVLVR
jgi:hypothetical protein